MSITVKIASTPKELDDVMWLRHEVYVIEDGKFGGKPLHGERIVDHYDVIPEVVHLIAYDGDEPVATMRGNCDRGGGLPPEEHYDFSKWRTKIEQELLVSGERKPVITSAGMLAVRKAWRSQRDVTRALYKIHISAMYSWKCTHQMVTVNYDTVSIYRRFGFTKLDEKQWVDEIGNYIVPMVANAEDSYKWAWHGFSVPSKELFGESYQHLLLRSGEKVFREGDEGDRAFIIDSGNIEISRIKPDGSKLVLSVLGRGDLFGELALIDDKERSATAEALGDVELISLDRDIFMRHTGMESSQLRKVLSLFSTRLRKTDELAMVLAFEKPDRRLDFALDTIRAGARPDSRKTGTMVASAGAEELARIALVEEEKAQAYLQQLHDEGVIEIARHRIRFNK